MNMKKITKLLLVAALLVIGVGGGKSQEILC